MAARPGRRGADGERAGVPEDPSTTALDQVRSVQISRDGSRALVVAGPRDAATAYLLRVDRTTGPPRLTRPRALVTGPVRAAAWASATQVALLIVAPDQPPQVGSVDLGLFSVRLLGGPPLAHRRRRPDRPLLSGDQGWADLAVQRQHLGAPDPGTPAALSRIEAIHRFVVDAQGPVAQAPDLRYEFLVGCGRLCPAGVDLRRV